VDGGIDGGASAAAADPTIIAVLDAVEGAQPCTVTTIAPALGVDQPRASRLVARAVTAGLLARTADRDDGRRALLALTDTGGVALEQARRFRRETIGRAMSGWSGADRAEFARLRSAFVDVFTDLTAEVLNES
jgi:DNA-binding MarR family transcriptional regulator